MSETSPFRWLAALALATLAFSVLFGKSYEATSPATDTATYADLALNATQHGFVPQFPVGAEKFGGHWGSAGFNDAPFFPMSLSGEILRYFGPTTWSARFFSGIFTVLSVLLLAAWGAHARKPLVGFFAGIILLASRDFVGDGLNTHLDNPMTFFIIGSFWAWSARRAFFAGILAGIGVWMKNPVALLILPTAFLASLLAGKLKEDFGKWTILVFSALLTASAIWIFTGMVGGWEIVRDYWVRQVWGTAIEGRGIVHDRDWFLIFDVLRTRWMPWVFLFLAGIVFAPFQRRVRESSFLLPLFGSVIVIAVVSMMRFKYSHYFVPAYPLMALIAAEPLAILLSGFEDAFYKFLIALSLALVTFLLCVPIPLSPESFPALKRFTAFIQSYGMCSDQVLFVNGGQPYGAFIDYKPEIEFYTGRSAKSAECITANEAANESSIAWVMLARENLHCLSSDTQARFSKTFRVGNQLLLSRVVPQTGEVDLTPLERELHAVLDCKAAPLPNDRYHSY